MQSASYLIFYQQLYMYIQAYELKNEIYFAKRHCFCRKVKKDEKNEKKPLTACPKCAIMALPLLKGFFFVRIFSGDERRMPRNCRSSATRKNGLIGAFQREVHGCFFAGSIKKIYMGGAAKWLMTQESRLLWHAPSASREITTRRKTRKMTLTDWSS